MYNIKYIIIEYELYHFIMSLQYQIGYKLTEIE